MIKFRREHEEAVDHLSYTLEKLEFIDDEYVSIIGDWSYYEKGGYEGYEE